MISAYAFGDIEFSCNVSMWIIIL